MLQFILGKLLIIDTDNVFRHRRFLIVFSYALRLLVELLYHGSLHVTLVHLLLVLIVQLCPLGLIILQILVDEVKFWEHLDCSRVRGFYDVIDEACVSFCDISSCSIHKLTHLEIVLLLEVTLSEEFTIEEVGPSLAEFPLLRWVRDVC